MEDNALTAELQGFITRFIHSVEQLEILCLVAENPEKAWTEAEIFQRIQSSPESVASKLRFFVSEKFLLARPEVGFRFAPASPDLARLAAELVRTYREKRVTVVEAIYKTPLDPIRNFADAFKIRKDKT